MLKLGIECENLEDVRSRWGVGRVTLSLVEEYVRNEELQKKYKLYLYFKKKIPDDEIFQSAHWRTKFKIRVLGFPSFNIFYHILMPIRAMFDQLDWFFFPAYQLPPLYWGKSIVMLTQDVYYEYKYGSLPFRYRLAYRVFTNWAAKFATKILAISETSRKVVAKLYKINPDKIFVAYPGINSRTSFIHDSKFIIHNSYLLYVGQMFPRRHSKETILAFKKLVKEHSDILKNTGINDLKLIMVGRDAYPPATCLPDGQGRAGNPPFIKTLVKETNNELGDEKIIYYDYIEKNEDLYKLYAGAKALIYVSDREAFGLPPMEALSFGTPPIITDNETSHELFKNNAFFVKNPTPEDIAQTIIKLLSDPGKTGQIQKNGPEFAKKYSWSAFAQRFFNNLK